MNQPIDVKYFAFEQDFMSDGNQCIPMIVRFKLDAVGIKMTVEQWGSLKPEEREELGNLPIRSDKDIGNYRRYLMAAIQERRGESVTGLSGSDIPNTWAQLDSVPMSITEQLKELNIEMSLTQWQRLEVLQRFALVKLTRAGHKNKNLPKALKEFGIT